MEITLEPTRVTKEMILNKVSEEQLMEHYLGVPVKKGLFRSPLRDDKNPTCAFYRNKRGDLIMKDFGSSFCGNFISVVMEKFQCSYVQALQIIGNDFGIIHKDFKVNKPQLVYTGSKMDESSQAIIRVEIREFQPYELAWWKTFGISKETLKKFNVFSCKNIWLNDHLFHLESQNQHIYGYYGGKVDGIEKWRIYHPMRKKYRFLSNWNSTQIQGMKQLPNTGDYLVITKSMKDCMVLYEFGIPAIAPNSENIFITEVQYNKLKQRFKHIVVIYDNDIPGLEGLRRIRKNFPDVKIAFIPRKYNAKDISDFYKAYGKEETQKLIDKTMEYYFGKEEEKNGSV